MATSTLIQKLDSGAEFGAATSNRSQTEAYLAGAAVAAGDWVMFDSGQAGADRTLFVIQAAAGVATGAPVIGVALNAATAAGQRVNVCVAGYVDAAAITTGIVADTPLCVDTTAGRADAGAAANIIICGVALGTAAANVGPAYVYKRV